MTLTKLHTLADAINEQHDLAEQHARTALEHARQAGQLLLEAKALCEHGTWGAWLKENFRGSDRTARSYMQVAANWEALEAKRQHVADLSLRGALEVLAEPKEDVSQELHDEAAANGTNWSQTEPEARNSYRTWLKTADALLAIRDNHLYRETHDDFISYLMDRFKVSRERALESERLADDPKQRVNAYILAQIVDIAPGIKFHPTHLEVPDDLDLSFEAYTKVMKLLSALPGAQGVDFPPPKAWARS